MKSFYAILIAVFAIACGGTTNRDFGQSDDDELIVPIDVTEVPPPTLEATPVIIWEPIIVPLHIGVNVILSMTVSNASDINSFALEQMLFSITTGGGVEYEVIPDPTIGINDMYNVDAFRLNGEVLPYSTLISASQPSVGVFTFREGDHFVTGEHPMRIEARVNVTNAPSGSWIETRLDNRQPLDEYGGYVYLVGIDFPGVWLSMKATDEQGALASTFLWSDLSAGADHTPPDYPEFSSSDYLTGHLVEGINGSTLIAAP